MKERVLATSGFETIEARATNVLFRWLEEWRKASADSREINTAVRNMSVARTIILRQRDGI